MNKRSLLIPLLLVVALAIGVFRLSENTPPLVPAASSAERSRSLGDVPDAEEPQHLPGQLAEEVTDATPVEPSPLSVTVLFADGASPTIPLQVVLLDVYSDNRLEATTNSFGLACFDSDQLKTLSSRELIAEASGAPARTDAELPFIDKEWLLEGEGPWHTTLRLPYYEVVLSGKASAPRSAARSLLVVRHRQGEISRSSWTYSDEQNGFQTVVYWPPALCSSDCDLLVLTSLAPQGEIIDSGLLAVAVTSQSHHVALGTIELDRLPCVAEGYVVTAEGTPAASATVQLSDPMGELLSTAQCDDAGYFRLQARTSAETPRLWIKGSGGGQRGIVGPIVKGEVVTLQLVAPRHFSGRVLVDPTYGLTSPGPSREVPAGHRSRFRAALPADNRLTPDVIVRVVPVRQASASTSELPHNEAPHVWLQPPSLDEFNLVSDHAGPLLLQACYESSTELTVVYEAALHDSSTDDLVIDLRGAFPSVEFTVVDESGQALSDASWEIEKDNSILVGAKASGRIPGELRATISCPGYCDRNVLIGSNSLQEITLTPARRVLLKLIDVPTITDDSQLSCRIYCGNIATAEYAIEENDLSFEVKLPGEYKFEFYQRKKGSLYRSHFIYRGFSTSTLPVSNVGAAPSHFTVTVPSRPE